MLPNFKQVLIIEEDAPTRRHLAELLAGAGYEILTAANGLDGIEQATHHQPHLIISGIDLPDLNGFEVLKALARYPPTNIIPFLFLTRHREQEEVRRGMNLGADDYLMKPFDDEELLEVIDLRLAKAARRQLRTPVQPDPDRGLVQMMRTFNERGQRAVFERGQTIVEDGQDCHQLYRVDEGRVHLVREHPYGPEYVMVDLGPNELFGVSSVLIQSTFPYDARAISDRVVVSYLRMAEVNELVASNPSVAAALLKELSWRARYQGNKLTQQAYDSVRRRLALVLLELQVRYGTNHIALGQRELAAMVGTTRESISRALADFRRAGYLAEDGAGVLLDDPAALRTVCERGGQ